MATNGNTGDKKRKKRSTRMGIMMIVALIIIGIAVVWGVQRWSEDDMQGPSVSEPVPVMLAQASGQIAA
jgi:hypothetical protein